MDLQDKLICQSVKTNTSLQIVTWGGAVFTLK